MYETSVRFQKAIRTTGRRKTILRVREAFSPTILYDNVPIVSGSLEVDRNSDVRRSATVKLGNSDLVDLFNSTDDNPFGLEIELLHGVVFIDGSEELVRLGLFTVDGFEWDEGDGIASLSTGRALPTLELMDRTQVVIRAKLEAARDFSGYMARGVIEQVLSGVIDGDLIVFGSGVNDIRLPGGSTFEEDRWEVVKTCASALGAEAYFDRDGILRIDRIKDPTGTLEASVFTFNTGESFSEIGGDTLDYLRESDRGILISAKRSIDRKQTYNAVAMYGAAPGGTTSQPFAIVKDSDPDSPTYYEGPFGKSVLRLDNQLLTTSTQCAEAAVAELNSRLGYSRGISFSAIGNPALDEGDYCLFHFQDGTQEVHLLDSYSLPLAGGAFTGETRTSPARQATNISITKGVQILERGPAAPGRPVLEARGDHFVSIRWQKSAIGATPIERYEIFNGDRHFKSVSGELSATVITGLPSGTIFGFHLVAVDFSGNESPPSRVLSVRTTGVTSPPLHPEVTTNIYQAIWSASYNGSNARVAKYDDAMYQGYKKNGLGNMRSLMGFDWKQIMRDMDGAYPRSATLDMYFSDWEVKTGGTAIIGFHNISTSTPSTWVDKNVFQDRLRSSGWPRAGRRKINLGASVASAFKVGKYKGIALGPAPTTSRVYRGRAAGANGGSVSPFLIISYTREV